MRNIPGWVLGALGVTAIVGATYAGSRIGAAAAVSTPATASTATYAADGPVAASLGELAVECEPGQRAMVSVSATTASAPRVACVSDAKPVRQVARAAFVPTEASPAATPVVYADDVPARPRPRRAAIIDPIEVYQPRSVPVSTPTRAEVEPRRSTKKSVAIIAGSTAAGAVVGGLTKGKKGAVIGGLIGGGAATVWDQVTRRRDDR